LGKLVPSSDTGLIAHLSHKKEVSLGGLWVYTSFAFRLKMQILRKREKNQMEGGLGI
jgi:hypothetical protein